MDELHGLMLAKSPICAVMRWPSCATLMPLMIWYKIASNGR
jgi:hypothetical protein